MKIIIIQPWIRQGGAEIISLYLAFYLKQLGHDVTIVTLFVKLHGLPKIFQKNKYITAPKYIGNLCSNNRLAFLVLGPIILLFLIFKHSAKSDIINPHNFPSSWIASIVGKFRSIPVVWSCNEPPLKISFKEVKNIGILDYFGWFFASSFLDRVIVKHSANAVVVLDEKNKKKVRELYGINSYIRYPGIDYVFYNKGTKRQLIKTMKLSKRFVLLCVGKLHSQKNQIICINAMKKVLIKVPEALLVFIGDGSIRKQLEEQCKKLKITRSVIFLGQQSPFKIRDWYKVCDINLFPAKGYQSWGFVPIEALCSKKISIVSNNCGVSYFLKNRKYGIVCSPNDHDFADNIIDVYQRKQKYIKMADNGHRYIKNELDWTTYAKRFEAIFMENMNTK